MYDASIFGSGDDDSEGGQIASHTGGQGGMETDALSGSPVGSIGTRSMDGGVDTATPMQQGGTMASGAQTATPATGATTNTASGLPTAGQVASTAPAPLQAFGGLPTVSPTYADPNQNQAYMQQYEGLEGAALAPQFQQQDQAEADQLASRGLTMSGAGAQLTNDLYGQQASALAGADAPIVSQGYGYTQQDIQGNQAAANQATATNAGYYNEALTGNASAYNNYLSQLYGTGAQTGNSELSAYLGSYGPNTGVESIMGTGLSGTQNAYTNIYDTMNQGQGTALGGLGSGLGTYYGDVAIAGAGG